VFDETLYDSGNADRLFDDILESGWDDDDGEPCTRARDLYHRHTSHWSRTNVRRVVCTKAKHDPCYELELPTLFDEDIARLQVHIEGGAVLFRARIGFVQTDDKKPRPFEGNEMGAPPPERVRPGRANAASDVLLYVADQEATAVAEVRPWRGLFVSVAELRTARDLDVLDLSKRTRITNPFFEEQPRYWDELEDLVWAFADELGRPLRRADDPHDYLPCQMLVRRIRSAGFYDGIRYPSAMSPGGTNLVLFDPTDAVVGCSKLVEVSLRNRRKLGERLG
jgi:RES domain-containing protein